MIWHWQQYLTLISSVFVIVIYMLALALYEVPKKRVECVFSILSTLFFQWVLYTGGWYGP